jgi:signal transduction histidine kinase/iron only hydrogenase large subunit-like protein
MSFSKSKNLFWAIPGNIIVMKAEKIDYLVYTVKNRCRVCYTCVRECPSKAIKIINGQAEVITERCIACGNCVKVCSQGAKAFHNSTASVLDLLENNENVIAMVAPAFPAEFSDLGDYKLLVSSLRKMGFWKVTEVSFGADIVADRYADLIKNVDDKRYISSDCPAIVSYVEHYYPQLIPSLVPYSSPMETMAKVVRKKYGEHSLVVFIGPCIAKKTESKIVDVSITFKELREIFQLQNIDFSNLTPSEFDGPFSAKGAIFPISRGLLNTMGVNDEFGLSNIQVTDGAKNFKDALTEFNSGGLNAKYLELLCCEGCISGPGMTSTFTRFKKRSLIGDYVKTKFDNTNFTLWENEKEFYKDLDLHREFSPADLFNEKVANSAIDRVLAEMGKNNESDFLNCGACGYETCREHAKAIVQGFAEDEMCLPNTIEKLHGSISALNSTNQNLVNAKEALKQSEKLAHMGQLSAGIAHELNNPLGVITMYANILIDETSDDNPIKDDLKLIVEQAERCKRIVGGLLNFARKNQVMLGEADVIELCKHSLKSVIIPENIETEVVSNAVNPIVDLDREQMIQVFTNLEKNAFEAMPNGGKLTIKISDNQNNKEVEILVSDNGSGISNENLTKIFTPFFTTKGIAKGTGLGLPLIYGIIKMHKGRISVISNDNPVIGATGTTFKIVLPRKPQDIKLNV